MLLSFMTGNKYFCNQLKLVNILCLLSTNIHRYLKSDTRYLNPGHHIIYYGNVQAVQIHFTIYKPMPFTKILECVRLVSNDMQQPFKNMQSSQYYCCKDQQAITFESFILTLYSFEYNLLDFRLTQTQQQPLDLIYCIVSLMLTSPFQISSFNLL